MHGLAATAGVDVEETYAQGLLSRPPLDFGPLPGRELSRLLVTGGCGSLGRRACSLAYTSSGQAWAYDTDRPREGRLGHPPEDVRDEDEFRRAVDTTAPTAVLHLAADKYAAKGEQVAARVADVNVRGTDVVARVCQDYDVPLAVASTCKAADPATAYGASKLIAERIATQNGARAVRLVNVLGSSGSVLRIWEAVHSPAPLPVAAAWRMWMTPREAVAALVVSLTMPPGVYAPVGVGLPERVTQLAKRAYPERRQRLIPLRLGDRYRERLVAEGETAVRTERDPLFRVEQSWQRQPEEGNAP